jgi:hypothetical protein
MGDHAMTNKEKLQLMVKGLNSAKLLKDVCEDQGWTEFESALAGMNLAAGCLGSFDTEAAVRELVKSGDHLDRLAREAVAKGPIFISLLIGHIAAFFRQDLHARGWREPQDN